MLAGYRSGRFWCGYGGVIFFQSDHPVAMMKAVQAVVHHNETADRAYELYLSEKTVTADLRRRIMHVTLVEINVHEDKVDEFIEVFRQNHLGSVQEEGNLRFDVLQDPEVNSRFYIYEAYKDEDAVAFHKTTPHYKTCVAKLESLMTGPRKKRLFNGLMP